MQNGIAFSYEVDVINLGEPLDLNTYNIAYILQPDSWKWDNFTLGMNFNYGYLKTTKYSNHQSVSTLVVAPVLRWYFLDNPTATPFLVASAGAGFVSSQYIGDRNLGSQLLFQTQGGLGLAFGAHKNVYTTIEVMHYSNARLANQNDGITVPLMMTLGVLF